MPWPVGLRENVSTGNDYCTWSMTSIIDYFNSIANPNPNPPLECDAYNRCSDFSGTNVNRDYLFLDCGKIESLLDYNDFGTWYFAYVNCLDSLAWPLCKLVSVKVKKATAVVNFEFLICKPKNNSHGQRQQKR